MDTLERYFSAGIDRAILGTAAVKTRAFLKSAVEAYGERIAVSVDLRNGKVAVNGWLEDSGSDAVSFIKELEEEGVSVILCTDISRDGIMQGTNFPLYRDLSRKTGMDIIASGGVSSVEEIRELAGAGLYGAVIGKAVYSGAVDLKQALEAAK